MPPARAVESRAWRVQGGPEPAFFPSARTRRRVTQRVHSAPAAELPRAGPQTPLPERVLRADSQVPGGGVTRRLDSRLAVAPLEKLRPHYARARALARVRAREETWSVELGIAFGEGGGASGIGSIAKCSSISSSGACWIMYMCVARELVQPNDRRSCRSFSGCS
jgi:hypothetical protein